MDRCAAAQSYNKHVTHNNRLANDVRARLDAAARHRQQLEATVRALQRNSKNEDADLIEQV